MSFIVFLQSNIVKSIFKSLSCLFWEVDHLPLRWLSVFEIQDKNLFNLLQAWKKLKKKYLEKNTCIKHTMSFFPYFPKSTLVNTIKTKSQITLSTAGDILYKGNWYSFMVINDIKWSKKMIREQASLFYNPGNIVNKI